MKHVVGFFAAFFALLTEVANARPGCVYQDAHLRIGPGGSYPSIGTIPGPTPVVLVRLGKEWSIFLTMARRATSRPVILQASVTQGRIPRRPVPCRRQIRFSCEKSTRCSAPYGLQTGASVRGEGMRGPAVAGTISRAFGAALGRIEQTGGGLMIRHRARLPIRLARSARETRRCAASVNVLIRDSNRTTREGRVRALSHAGETSVRTYLHILYHNY